MNLSLEKLEIHEWGTRELTIEDFHRICEQEKIAVLEIDVPTSFYFYIEGRSFIVLKKKLKGLRKTFAAFHELAHHFLHGGRDAESAFFFGMLENKIEVEADALAIIALLPLKTLSTYEFLNDHPNWFAKKLWRERQRIYFLYRI